jgi:hypothetical protein
MEKFLYLNEIDHISAWVSGGGVPLKLASSYRSRERQGSRTPDECAERDCPTDPDEAWRGLSRVLVGATPDNCDVEDVKLIGQGATWLTDRYEDGLILCLSNSFDIEKHANRYPKDACVRILDVDALRRALDEQLGVESEMRACEYTTGKNRGPFLKSVADDWQEEFRLYWKDIQEAKRVELPAGLAVERWRRTTEPRPVRNPGTLQAPQEAPVDPRRRNSISGPTIFSPGFLFGFPRDPQSRQKEGS